MIKKFLLSLACLCFAIPAMAQQMQPVLMAETARKIIDGCHAFAVENELNVVIAIYDAGADLNAFKRMDGAQLGSVEIAQWKGESSAKFRRPTAGFSERAREFPSFAAAPGIAIIRGGVNIPAEDGTHMGGIGVSGASSADDERCALAGLEAAGLTHPLITAEE